MGVNVVTAADVQRIGKLVNLPYYHRFLLQPEEVDIKNMPTCGRWFYRSCSELTLQQLDKAGQFGGRGNSEDHKVAYHGAALSNV